MTRNDFHPTRMRIAYRTEHAGALHVETTSDHSAGLKRIAELETEHPESFKNRIPGLIEEAQSARPMYVRVG